MATGHPFTFRIPDKLKRALKAAIKDGKVGKASMSKVLLGALREWMEQHAANAKSGIEPFDDVKASEDGSDTVQVNLTRSLRDELRSAAEARKELEPKAWPNSMNAIGVQALSNWLRKRGLL
jgi:Arc/MetJ-type ribon-helix-helix transcriptional regulator